MFVLNNKFLERKFMDNALKLFYYQFHTEQHYFYCHDILEEAWKENPSFSKNDPVVSLILFATGCYHYRRHNYIGAKRSFQRAYKVITQATSSQYLGLNINYYQKLIVQMISNIEQQKAFEPIQLPITETMEQQILQDYPNYILTPYVIDDEYIVHHHIKRDRSEVIQARQEAIQNNNRLSK